MAGFWETFSQNAGGAFDNYNQLKEQKRQRALQKMKFLTENADVGTPVDAETQRDISDYASEGSGLIKDGAYVGSPDQQREAEFRQYVNSNPQASPEDIMTRGAASGAVPAGTYGSFLSGQEARSQRMLELQMRLQQQKELQEDRQQQQMLMRGIIESGINSRRAQPEQDETADFYGTKANRQKLVANRRMYGNDPYGHLINKVFGDPASAAQALQMEGEDEVDINRPEPWDNFLRNLDADPEFRNNLMTDYGLRNQELMALQSHIKGIANKRRGK